MAKKVKRVNIRLTEETHTMLIEKSKARDMTITAYLEHLARQDHHTAITSTPIVEYIDLTLD